MVVLLGGGMAFAQGRQPPGSATRSQDPKKIETIEIRGKDEGDPNSILPTKQALDSVYGDERSILDTPRSVTVLSEIQLRDAGVTRILDLPRAASGTFAPNTFGYASLPTIRGQQGELFVGGMRRGGGNNSYGFPISFNAFQQINVVKGTPSSVYGPTQRVGGYLDLVPKLPNPEEWTTEVRARYGSWANRGIGFDLGGPVNETLAVRLSYDGQKANSYYDYVHENYNDIYGAVTWQASRNLRIDFNADYYHVDYSDNAGWNRPTQQLIDHGTYITGQGVSPVTGLVPGPGSVTSPTGTAHLSRSRVLTDPSDLSRAQTITSQLSAQYSFSEATTLTNRTLFQSLQKKTINNNSFREILPENYILENRTELGFEFGLPIGGTELPNKVTTGFDFRFNHARGYSQFNTEADNAIDLSLPFTTRRLTDAQVAALSLGNSSYVSAPVFGSSQRILASPGATYPNPANPAFPFNANGDTNDSNAYDYGLFYQDDVKLTDQIGLLFGLRGDIVHVYSKDPIPPPGQKAQSANLTTAQGAANISLRYKPTDNALYYATYSYSQSSPSAIGGGFTIGSIGHRNTFQTDSVLQEIGAKWNLLDNTLYAGVAWFHQTRADRTITGSISGVIAQGAELDLAYQPTPNFHMSANASWTNAHFHRSNAFQSTVKVEDAFDNSRPDIIAGTGVPGPGSGSPTLSGTGLQFPFVHGSGTYPLLPKLYGSVSLSYEFDSGFGVSTNLLGMTRQNLDVLGHVRIPNQFTWNAAVFYKLDKRYELRLDVYNITNEENFSGLFTGGYFGADLVMPDLPTSFVASMRAKF